MTKNSPARIGDFLVAAGVISSDVLEERLEVSKLLCQPLGKTLVQLGDLSRYQLLSLVQLQSLCLDGALTPESVIEALRLMHADKMFLEDALQKVGFIDDGGWTAKLGELLLESTLITEEQLKIALDRSFQNCTPLGQVLLQSGVLTPTVVAKALSIQKRVRSGELARTEAVEELGKYADDNVPVVEV